MCEAEIFYWRRIDIEGLERLVLTETTEAVVAHSTVICLEGCGFLLKHRWDLTSDWRTRTLLVERWAGSEFRRLTLERTEGGWLVDGARRPDLDGTDEPDLSVTPFCNSLPIRKAPSEMGNAVTLDTCFVDGASMTVQRSRQGYVRIGERRFRYIDLGTSAGFEAELEVDEKGLVLRYEHLFERVAPER
jgi:uncharacterized protein